ncbi:MAG: AmmeMemoRadiSam system protein B [candidate division KSB1 bacterium]|nr:AmmeMemoRadiSam system protein B [candidate division KSB1 bacterium]MDZ7385134.1 AmmeMemoRadiSam system protein B [candidate division KSB1 bacterium]
MATSGEQTRPAAFAGTFYPGSPRQLDALVTRLLDEAPDETIPGEIIGLIAPHAGYLYSGSTAATAYKQVMGKPYESIVIIAPSHRELFREGAVAPFASYATPLGEVPVDRALAEQIVAQNKGLSFSEHGHQVRGEEAEHSLEVHLPFLQKALPGVPIVPIVISDYGETSSRRFGEALAQAIGKRKVLLVASTDLYHGYSYEDCKLTDARTIAALQAFDPEDFVKGAMRGTYQACGAGPVSVLLHAARLLQADTVTVLAQTNSADATGVRGGYVVGYVAAAVSRPA